MNPAMFFSTQVVSCSYCNLFFFLFQNHRRLAEINKEKQQNRDWDSFVRLRKVLLCEHVIHTALSQVHFNTPWRSAATFSYQNSVVCRHVSYDLVYHLNLPNFQNIQLLDHVHACKVTKDNKGIWRLPLQEHGNDQLSRPVSMALPDLYNYRQRKYWISI